MYHLQRCVIETFFDKDYSTNYGFLKRIISADDVVSEAFDDILNKMKGSQEPTVQTSTGGCCMCNQPDSAGERHFSAA